MVQFQPKIQIAVLCVTEHGQSRTFPIIDKLVSVSELHIECPYCARTAVVLHDVVIPDGISHRDYEIGRCLLASGHQLVISLDISEVHLSQ